MPSMIVKVRFFATIREKAGKKEVDVNVQGESIDILNLIRLLSDKLGEEFERTILDPETHKIRPYIKIMVNGRDIEFLNGLETTLKDGDVVQVFPPVGGG
jgi:molybdopterin synthase sulfur carrier subunit